VRDRRLNLGMHQIRAGDAILVSGPVGDHGIAVMFAREAVRVTRRPAIRLGISLSADPYTGDASGAALHARPDAGGLATVMHEIAHATASASAARIRHPGARSGDVGVRDAGLRPDVSRLRRSASSLLLPGKSDQALGPGGHSRRDKMPP
jgi:hydrogenase expression/formation protein HypE